MIYCFSKMALKIVLFITILSSFGGYKGVQCTNSILDVYTAVDEKNIDIYQRKCYLVLFITIHREYYVHHQGITKITFLNLLAGYYLRLLRLYDNNSVHLEKFNTQIWSFYVDFKHWNSLDHMCYERRNSENGILDRAKQLIDMGVLRGVWNDVSTEDNVYIHFERVVRDFNYCKESLEYLTEKTRYLDEEINTLLLDRDLELGKLMQRFEILTTFGFIICLMESKDEFHEFMSKKDKSEQKPILIDIMITILNRINEGVIAILSLINVVSMSKEAFDTLIKSDTEVGNQLTIIKTIYLNAIEVTKAMYKINEHKFIQQYGVEKRKIDDVDNTYIRSNINKFIEYFQAKFLSLCPTCFNKTTIFQQTILNKVYGAVTPRGSYRFFSFIKQPASLEIYTAFRVNPLIIGFYNTCFTFDYGNSNAIQSNSLKRLLELNVWLVIIRNCAKYLHEPSPSSNAFPNHEAFFDVEKEVSDTNSQFRIYI